MGLPVPRGSVLLLGRQARRRDHRHAERDERPVHACRSTSPRARKSSTSNCCRNYRPIPEVLEHIEAQHGRIPFAVVSGSTPQLGLPLAHRSRICWTSSTPSSELKTTSKPSLLRTPSCWPPSGWASPPPTAWCLKTPTWASRPQRPPVWLRCAFPRRRNGAERKQSGGNCPPPTAYTSLTPEGSTRHVMTQASPGLQPESHATLPRTAVGRSCWPIAAAVTLLHLLTNGRYGFHRDELQFLSDARHLDWGFVAYPPFTPVRRAHQPGPLRAFAGWAAAVLRPRPGRGHCHHRADGARAGRRRLAQVAAALAVALSPLPLFEGTEFQYTSSITCGGC